ncbi:MAG: hypothetical protein L3J88_09305 [Gammaproteobacteria bacterium]|nr:hypothetical protein [Gammaproteobacteria bacterium]
MKILFLSILTFLLASCAYKNVSHENKLVFFANNFQLMSETKNTEPTLSARLIKLKEFGECDNGKCPNEVIYIAVSGFGEYPEQRLYITKPANEWKFLGWEHVPALGEKKQAIVFKMKSYKNNSETEYTIKVSLDNIEYIDQDEIIKSSSGR